MGKYELTLTKDYVKDWMVADAVRELLQNAIDQEAQDSSNKMFFEYVVDEQLLRIGNKNSVLEARSLLLGATTKASDDKTIGQFGEGYKIATLVLTRLEKQVIFYNYGKNEIWKPRFVKSRRFGDEILTFFTEKFIWSKTPDNNLTIEISGITKEEYEVIKQNTLQLRDEYPEHMKTIYGNIFATADGKAVEELAGKIFVNGLYVRT